jgi:hypothetical protein
MNFEIYREEIKDLEICMGSRNFEYIAPNQKDKEKLEAFIINVSVSSDLDLHQQDLLIREALMVLAKHTGCAEDAMVAEAILDSLFDKKYISTEQMQVYYEHNNLGRWE